MKRLLVLEIPGLTRGMVERHAPNLRALAGSGPDAAPGSVLPERPAVTMPGHASFCTGLAPAEHGIVANGWYDRGHDQVFMWRQSEQLVAGEMVWEAAKKRDPSFTCLKHFWWPGMASSADLCVNVRPVYFADGRKHGSVYTSDHELANQLQSDLGDFPLFRFWGPAVDLSSTQWIADAAQQLFRERSPTLSLVYLPHLDYMQQSHGPDALGIASEVAALDAVAGGLIDAVRETADQDGSSGNGVEIMVLSGYAIAAVDKPVHLNRLFREQGWLSVMRNAAGELIDYSRSRAFAVADHQVAHIYCDDPAEVRGFLSGQAGVGAVHDGFDHPRSGDLFVEAAPGSWFTYYYWLDDADAPDFARTVAIHSKPGYDPCELFLDPSIAAPKLKIAAKVLRKKLGFRYLMDVIPLDASLVRGSHGLVDPAASDEAPVFLSSRGSKDLKMTEVKDEMLAMMFD